MANTTGTTAPTNTTANTPMQAALAQYQQATAAYNQAHAATLAANRVENQAKAAQALAAKLLASAANA